MVAVLCFQDCIEATKKDIDQSGLLAPIVGHVGDGNFHVMLSVDTKNEEEMSVAKKINQRMVQRAIAMEGTCTGEHGVGVGKRDYLDYELGQTTVEMMRKIKLALDPHSLMNPDKVFRLESTHSHSNEDEPQSQAQQEPEKAKHWWQRWSSKDKQSAAVQVQQAHDSHQEHLTHTEAKHAADDHTPGAKQTQYSAAPIEAPDHGVQPPQKQPSVPPKAQKPPSLPSPRPVDELNKSKKQPPPDK